MNWAICYSNCDGAHLGHQETIIFLEERSGISWIAPNFLSRHLISKLWYDTQAQWPIHTRWSNRKYWNIASSNLLLSSIRSRSMLILVSNAESGENCCPILWISWIFIAICNIWCYLPGNDAASMGWHSAVHLASAPDIVNVGCLGARVTMEIYFIAYDETQNAKGQDPLAACLS